MLYGKSIGTDKFYRDNKRTLVNLIKILYILTIGDSYQHCLPITYKNCDHSVWFIK